MPSSPVLPEMHAERVNHGAKGGNSSIAVWYEYDDDSRKNPARRPRNVGREPKNTDCTAIKTNFGGNIKEEKKVTFRRTQRNAKLENDILMKQSNLKQKVS